jgi:hypothetical protein
MEVNTPVIKHVQHGRLALLPTLSVDMWTSSAELANDNQVPNGVRAVVMRKRSGDRTVFFTVKRVDDGSFEADVEYIEGDYMGRMMPEGFVVL